MFFFGFLVGIVVAAAFILYGDGELVIGLGQQMKRVAERVRSRTRQGTGPSSGEGSSSS